ncbi:MAG: hypothetical protein C4567_15515 [Deltaproteobacteria bacterium]|nr:MAG: hypothetical protein C4567_15515 [Deltaproteobacteria bacterium]
MAQRRIIILSIILAILSIPVMAQAEPAKLGQVIYITRSKACGCTAEKVKAADKVVNQAFAGSRQASLKRIDYDTDRQAAVPYIGQFRLIQLPALLLLDSQGRLLWSAIGIVDPNKLEEQLKGFGA